MRKTTCLQAAGLLTAGAAIFAGCSTTPDQTHQFEPVPVAKVGAQDLDPVSKDTATDLLKAADAAFRRANEAQEAGDQQGALRHYNTMLQLLIEADLDPSVFYSLRTEFERILDSTTETANLFERSGVGELGPDARVGGELFAKGFINERVIAEIEEIQKLYPKNFQWGLDRSYLYRPYIEQELMKAGLPKDLVWLAMVESQFHPNVTSRAGASGMWQFMRATGSRYGLQIDSYVDERRDWQKATHAAIAYLRDLNAMFDGEWPLAVSSYNMGEGGISRAIAMNGGERDLWQLIETPPASSHMKTETKKFYPKFLASVIVGNNPERYGFTRNPQPPEPIVRVPVRGSYSLSMLDKESGLESGTLKRLNPDLIKGVTPPSGEHAIAVPAAANEKFLAALDEIYKSPKKATYASTSGGATHTVRRGETPSGIARKYGVPVKDLMEANRIRSASKLHVGKKLVIPGREAAPEPAPAAATPEPSAPAAAVAAIDSGNAEEYRVKRGDTLYDIARAKGVSLDDLQAWNGLDRRARISVGQSLYVSDPRSGSSPAAAPDGQKIIHKVRPGEFPSKIAEQHGVDIDNLLAWNNLSKRSIIRVGDELVVYSKTAPQPVQVASTATPEKPTTAVLESAAASTSTAEPGPQTTHKVAPGESASVIASKHGISLDDFLKWNGLSKNDIVKVGQVLVVSAPGTAAPTAPSTVEPDIVTASHTVASGESPWTIASKYGMDLGDLLAMNGLSKNAVLRTGQTLKVAGATGTSSPLPAASQGHTVKSGESAWTIAQKYGVSVDDLLAANGLSKNSVLKAGQELKVPLGGVGSNSSSSSGKTIVHKTTAGQSPSTIAQKYGVSTSDLFKWNNWSKSHVLQIGEEVTIHTK
ncbi:MAG: hypothetical protein AMXMBFR82_25160 [Candidatus Hydrogenedentota bacterium]